MSQRKVVDQSNMANRFDRKKQKLNSLTKNFSSCLPARYVFGVMSMLGVMVAYIMRACLSIALTQMVIPVNASTLHEHISVDEYCPDPEPYHVGQNHTEKGMAEFEWNEEAQGMILSAFYYGYIITHVPGSLVAQKWGGKYTLGIGILWTALLTLLTPIVVYWGNGIWALIILRFLEGIGEGVTFPALCTMLAQWAPPSERSTLSTVAFTGVQIGSVLANLIGGIILEYLGGWKVLFYTFGIMGIVWFILWTVFCYDDPSSHPFITDKEKLYLKESIGQVQRKAELGAIPPWKHILTSLPFWALVIAEVGHDWGLYTMVTDLPKYMADVMKFNPSQNGLMSSFPYFATWITSIVSSSLADYLLRNEYASCTVLRKTFATFGAVGPAIGVMLASYVGCDKIAATIYFTAGMAFMGFCYCSVRVNALDLSPNYSGTIMAFVNGAGCVSGMLTPYFTGLLTPNRTVKEWRLVFWIMVAMLIGSNFVFVFFASGDAQPWNDPTVPSPSPSIPMQDTPPKDTKDKPKSQLLEA